MKTWLLILERIINDVLVEEETMYIQAVTKEGAELKGMEYFIEDGWCVVATQAA